MGVVQGDSVRQKELNRKKVAQLKKRAEKTLALSKPKTVKASTTPDYADNPEKQSGTRLYLLCLLAISCVLLLGSGPPLIMNAIGQAAYEHDSKKLETKLDYAQLRQNALKRNVILKSNFLAEDARSSFDSQFFYKLLAQSTADDSTAAPGFFYYVKNIQYSFESFNRVKATVTASSTSPSSFILERNGLTWKIIDIITPNDSKS